MSKIDVFRGIRAPFTQTPSRRGLSTLALALVLALAGGAATAQATEASGATSCAEVYDPSASYPALPESQGPDVSGEAGVVMYLHDDHAVVELEGCFYEADRFVVIDFAGLDFVTLLVELPDHGEGAQVYLSEDGAWVETLSVTGSSFSYVMTPEHALGFEIAAPGSAAPTGPIIRTKPTGGNPEPK